VSDQKLRVSFFESTQSPFLLWLRLDDFDFSPGAPTLKLTLTDESAAVEDGEFLSGNVSSRFAPAESFAFMPA
jgi:hypothetical protein